MMRGKISFFLLCMFTLIACTSAPEQDMDAEKEVPPPPSTEPIEATIQIPESLNTDEIHTLSVQLKQNKQPVDDASDVTIEIWQDQQKEKSEKVEAIHQKNGVYQIEKSFDQEGIFYIQAHCTARGQHMMPVQQVVVGDISDEQLKSKEQEKSSDEHHHH